MSKYFTKNEFRCACCGELPDGGIDERLLEVCDAIREAIGKPITVLSGYRCAKHNAEVGGVPNSQHVLGTAADLTFDEVDIERLAQVAEAVGADGIGRYPEQSFVHVDTRGYEARWNG